MNELEKKIVDLCLRGLYIDGGHHKQWFLEEILKLIIDVDSFNTLQYVKEMGDWEDGIAP